MYTQDIISSEIQKAIFLQITTAAYRGLAFFSIITSLTPQSQGLFSMHPFMFINCFLQMFEIIINGKKVFWVFQEKTRQMLKCRCPAHFRSLSSQLLSCQVHPTEKSVCYKTGRADTHIPVNSGHIYSANFLLASSLTDTRDTK